VLGFLICVLVRSWESRSQKMNCMRFLKGALVDLAVAFLFGATLPDVCGTVSFEVGCRGFLYAPEETLDK